VTSALGAEAYPTWSPEGGRLAYHLDQASDGRNFDIWVAQIGGGQPVNLTRDHKGIDRHPSWSPDGRWIAFWSDRGGGGYFVMPALGGAPRELLEAKDTGFSEATRPQWSSDGKRLACVVGETKDVQSVEIVALDPGESRRWALPSRSGDLPLDLAWSPDGRYFAYVAARWFNSLVGQIFVLDLEEGKAESVTEGRTNVWSPFWSSDGRYLYFVSNHDVWAIPATGGEARQVTDHPAEDFQPSWSPDGKWLAFVSTRSGVHRIWRVAAAGGEPREVSKDGSFIPRWPRWSPDGKWIYIIGLGESPGNFWVVPVDSGRARRLTDLTSRRGSSTGFATDGRYLYFAWQEGLGDIWVADVVYD